MKRFIKRLDRERHAVSQHRRRHGRRQLRPGQGRSHRLSEIRQARLLKGKGSLEEKLKPLGYKVAWTEFPSGPPLLEALNVGAIDFGITGEAPPIFAQAAGAPLLYVGL